MLTTTEALDLVLAAMPELPVESVAVSDSTGRTLRQTVIAERDQPPFDRVMMDGIAIAHADYAQGQRSFPVQATQMAGQPALQLDAGHCIEIMTGAALPAGADCIVPVERLEIVDGAAELEDDYAVQERQFIHPQASDYADGDELLGPGKRIAAMDIAVFASAGLADDLISSTTSSRLVIAILRPSNRCAFSSAFRNS